MSGNGGDSSGQGGSSGGGQEQPRTDGAETPKTTKPEVQDESSCGQQTESASESTEHKTPLCRISIFLAGFIILYCEWIVTQISVQILQLGDKYRRGTGTNAGSVIPNNSSIWKLIGLQPGVADNTPEASQSPGQGENSGGGQPEAGDAGPSETTGTEDKGGSSCGQPQASADSKPTEPKDHKVRLYRISMFISVACIDIADTQADDANAIDFSGETANTADREPQNKGIHQLFENKTLDASSSAGEDTGHAGDW